jgi:phosphatidate cytidylyltransferase
LSSGLAARVVTAAILVAGLLAALFWLPRTGVAIVAGVVVLSAAREWARLCGHAGLRGWIYAGAAALAMGGLFVADQSTRVPALLAASLFWLIVAPIWLWRGVKAGHRIALMASGWIVLVPAGLALATLRPANVLMVLVLVWIVDTAAYFVGRRWGRRKLAPSISPGKTWEGAVGGVLGAAAYAMIGSIGYGGVQWLPFSVVCAVLLAVISIVGDLFESAAKRQAGVKDSGTLLPGHGGVLDRIDSAVAVLPIAAFLLSLPRP